MPVVSQGGHSEHADEHDEHGGENGGEHGDHDNRGEPVCEHAGEHG